MKILTAKKLADRLTAYAVEDKENPDKAGTFVSAAIMIRRQRVQIEKLKKERVK